MKVISRWYYTPVRLASMYSPVDPLCFRGCKLSGTMAHILWECPRVRPFVILVGAKLTVAKLKISWIMVQEKLSSILSVTVKKFEAT